jgi:hypothetical protein
MRFMILVKADKDSEAGILPGKELLTAMGQFNEQLVKAGVMLAGEGLQPSSKGARVRFSGSKPTVIDGPFAETKELVAGYWIWNVKSLDEAVEWAKRCPNPMPGEEGVLEIRPCYTLEDLSDIVPNVEFEREVRLRKQVARQQKAKPKAAPARGKSAKRPAKRKPRRAKPK